MDIDGFLNINKPEGISSTDVVRAVKKELSVKKVGYIGTLDPMATGVLPVGMGRATRLFPFLEKEEKIYNALMTLGSSTDTLDRTGKTLKEADPSGVTADMVKAVMEGFKGEIEQIPPMFSAKKIKGERLYDLARQGVVVEREPVKTTVYELEFIEKNGNDVRFTARVAPGTYVRTLCDDIGEKLGVYAHLASLVRVKSSGFTLENSIPLEEIKGDNEKVKDMIISLPDALTNMSKVVVLPHAVERIKNGMPIGISEIVNVDMVEGATLVRVITKKGDFACVGAPEGLPIAGFPFSSIIPKKVFI